MKNRKCKMTLNALYSTYKPLFILLILALVFVARGSSSAAAPSGNGNISTSGSFDSEKGFQMKVRYQSGGNAQQASGDASAPNAAVLKSIAVVSPPAAISIGGSYDLSGANAIAVYSNGKTKKIRPAWSVESGGGYIVKQRFFAPATPGRVKIKAAYFEKNVSKTASFTVRIGPGDGALYGEATPLTLQLTPESVTVPAGESSFDLSKIEANVIYPDNLKRSAGDRICWTVKAGSGTIAAGTYSIPDKAETTILTASYIENGVMASADLTLVIQKIKSIKLNMNKIEILPAESSHDIVEKSGLKVFAIYSDGSEKDVTALAVFEPVSPETSITGNGLYYPSKKSSETSVKVKYCEGGAAFEEHLAISTATLESIKLARDFERISGGRINLRNIEVTALYSNGKSADVTSDTRWTATVGAGTLENDIYSKKTGEIEAKFTATYILQFYDGEIAKQAAFTTYFDK